MNDKQILKRLRWEFWIYVLLCVLLVVLYETRVLLEGSLIGLAQTVYIVEVSGVLLTIALTPLALKSYHLALTRMAPLPNAQRRRSYVKWNEIRLSLFVVVTLLNLSIYYMTLDNLGGYCALIGALASLFCWPSRQRIEDELLPEEEQVAVEEPAAEKTPDETPTTQS